MSLLLRKILASILSFFPLFSFALPEDTSQNMHIIADSTLFNYKTGFNVYEGNVQITQGETRLSADRVTTQNNAQHKMEEAIAYGTDKNPAHYWTILKKEDPLFHAQAKVIKFYPIKSTVVLEGDAVVIQGKNSFNGPVIVYNIQNQTVSAPASTKGHATIIIESKQLQL